MGAGPHGNTEETPHLRVAEPVDPVDRNLARLDAFTTRYPWVRVDTPRSLGLPFWRASWLGHRGVRARAEAEDLGCLLDFLYKTFDFHPSG